MDRYLRWHAIRGGLRVAKELGSVPGGTGSFDRAGISMAFSEGLSDDGSLTGRGSLAARRVTGLDDHAGGHRAYSSLLISSFSCRNAGAVIIVAVELGVAVTSVTALDTPFLQAAFQVYCRRRAGIFDGLLIGSA